MPAQKSLEKIATIYNLLCDIKGEYTSGIQPILIKNSQKFFYNPHRIPKIKKIVVNRGLSSNAQNNKILKKNIEEFEIITGQKPILIKAKKSIANFKIRQGNVVGLSVTLRGDKMYNFLTKTLFFTFSRIKDFQGLSIKSFDQAGNYTFGFQDQFIFPEIEYDTVDQIQGLSLNVVLEHNMSKKKDNSIAKILNSIFLFKMLQFPLKDYGHYNFYDSIDSLSAKWSKKRSLLRKRWSK